MLEFDYNYKNYKNEIKSLYLEAFPQEERRKISEIKENIEKEACQIISILYQKTFAGFFILLKNKSATLIDYFAIKEEFRGKNIGSKAIKKLDQGRPILIEIEPLDKNAENNEERIRRKSFYERLGFRSSDILVDRYDTNFELMSLNEKKIIPSYFGLLDDIFSKEERQKHIRLAKTY